MILGWTFVLVYTSICQIAVHCNEDFYWFSQRDHFVDKSELMLEFLREDMTESREHRPHSTWTCFYYYITCPRDFGKTTNLNMIRSFTQIELDDQHVAKLPNETYAYRAFKKLKIGLPTNYDLIKYHLGQYAVIFLDLEFTDVELSSDEKARSALVKKIQRCYKEYDWMRENYTMELERAMMRKVVSGNLTRVEITRSLLDLNNILMRHFKPLGVILLVDNFDSAASNAVFTKGLRINQLYIMIHEMLFRVTSTKNTRVKYLFMTGITNLYFKSPVLERLSNIQHYPFLENTRFAKYFGFEEQEVLDLMKKYQCTKEEQFMVWSNYKGYNIVHKCLIFLYNPYSITRFMLSKRLSATGLRSPKAHWARKEQVYYIKEFIRVPLFRQKLLELLRKGLFIFEPCIKDHNPGMFQSFLEMPDRDYGQLHEDDVPELFAFVFERGLLRHTPAMYTYEWASQEIRKEIIKKLKYREIGVLM